jgi:hypothetical protein
VMDAGGSVENVGGLIGHQANIDNRKQIAEINAENVRIDGAHIEQLIVTGGSYLVPSERVRPLAGTNDLSLSQPVWEQHSRSGPPLSLLCRPWQGRQTELEDLKGLCDLQGPPIVISGPPGFGKSSLAARLYASRELVGQRCLWLAASLESDLSQSVIALASSISPLSSSNSLTNATAVLRTAFAAANAVFLDNVSSHDLACFLASLADTVTLVFTSTRRDLLATQRELALEAISDTATALVLAEVSGISQTSSLLPLAVAIAGWPLLAQLAGASLRRHIVVLKRREADVLTLHLSRLRRSGAAAFDDGGDDRRLAASAAIGLTLESFSKRERRAALSLATLIPGLDVEMTVLAALFGASDVADALSISTTLHSASLVGVAEDGQLCSVHPQVLSAIGHFRTASEAEAVEVAFVDRLGPPDQRTEKYVRRHAPIHLARIHRFEVVCQLLNGARWQTLVVDSDGPFVLAHQVDSVLELTRRQPVPLEITLELELLSSSLHTLLTYDAGALAALAQLVGAEGAAIAIRGSSDPVARSLSLARLARDEQDLDRATTLADEAISDIVGAFHDGIPDALALVVHELAQRNVGWVRAALERVRSGLSDDSPRSIDVLARAVVSEELFAHSPSNAVEMVRSDLDSAIAHASDGGSLRDYWGDNARFVTRTLASVAGYLGGAYADVIESATDEIGRNDHDLPLSLNVDHLLFLGRLARNPGIDQPSRPRGMTDEAFEEVVALAALARANEGNLVSARELVGSILAPHTRGLALATLARSAVHRQDADSLFLEALEVANRTPDGSKGLTTIAQIAYLLRSHDHEWAAKLAQQAYPLLDFIRAPADRFYARRTLLAVMPRDVLIDEVWLDEIGTSVAEWSNAAFTRHGVSWHRALSGAKDEILASSVRQRNDLAGLVRLAHQFGAAGLGFYTAISDTYAGVEEMRELVTPLLASYSTAGGVWSNGSSAHARAVTSLLPSGEASVSDFIAACTTDSQFRNSLYTTACIGFSGFHGDEENTVKVLLRIEDPNARQHASTLSSLALRVWRGDTAVMSATSLDETVRVALRPLITERYPGRPGNSTMANVVLAGLTAHLSFRVAVQDLPYRTRHDLARDIAVFGDVAFAQLQTALGWFGIYKSDSDEFLRLLIYRFPERIDADVVRWAATSSGSWSTQELVGLASVLSWSNERVDIAAVLRAGLDRVLDDMASGKPVQSDMFESERSRDELFVAGLAVCGLRNVDVLAAMEGYLAPGVTRFADAVARLNRADDKVIADLGASCLVLARTGMLNTHVIATRIGVIIACYCPNGQLDFVISKVLACLAGGLPALVGAVGSASSALLRGVPVDRLLEIMAGCEASHLRLRHLRFTRTKQLGSGLINSGDFRA